LVFLLHPPPVPKVSNAAFVKTNAEYQPLGGDIAVYEETKMVT